MPTPFSPTLKRLVLLFVLWAVILFVAVLLSVFLHEVGHGVGAKIDGIHVSTGFNKVGNPGRTPDDPDFRTDTAEGFWSGLLGPMTTWALAIAFTVWLYWFRKPGWGALAIGALAVVNGLVRAVPMLMFLISALGGRLHVEDEVFWGIWQVANVFRPDLASLGLRTLAETQPGLLLSYPAVWIPPLVSLVISLACLILAYRKILKLWRAALGRWGARLFFGLLPLPVYYVATPVLNALDRMIRINW